MVFGSSLRIGTILLAVSSCLQDVACKRMHDYRRERERRAVAQYSGINYDNALEKRGHSGYKFYSPGTKGEFFLGKLSCTADIDIASRVPHRLYA